MMKKYLFKVDGLYYAGEHEQTVTRSSGGWYQHKSEANAIFFVADRNGAKVCDGLVNLNSHYQRIYNAMRFDGLDINKIEIEAVE
jgi:hypothetical protein